jgi:hypothetical protein
MFDRIMESRQSQLMAATMKWIQPEPEELDEKCPKCQAPLVMMTTRAGKKRKM